MNTSSTASSRIHSSLGASGSKLHSSRDELITKRYSLVEPQDVYPLDGASPANHQLQSSAALSATSVHYPDFLPWKHTPKEDELAVNHLQKGYLETPFVGNELLSARNVIHQLLHSRNSLDELSSNLLKAIDVRSSNNKIGQSLFKPPPRVTLTDQKREAWLRDLAQNNVPLRKLARTIPHGVRNKVLLEQCIAKNIPMNRAIWFVRCVSTNELRGLKRKGGPNVELNWVQEWTIQVVEFIEKLSLDYLRFETFQQATESWKFNISYILRFCSNLYIENLIDHDSFKNWINKFFKTCKNFELPLALTIIRIFWDELIRTDYLIKEITESLILRYQKVKSLQNILDLKDQKITDFKLNEDIKSKLLNDLQQLILVSFHHSIDNFILPNDWTQLKGILKSILNLSDPQVARKFELISYRNESLMINYSLNKDVVVQDLITVLDNRRDSVDYKQMIDLVFNDCWKRNLEYLIYWSITRYRNEDYRIILSVEILKRSKSMPLKVQIPAKEIEQELMDIVFRLYNHTELIEFQNLFILLNELSSIKMFKPSIYMRRLISSGLVYVTDNPLEKTLHSSILKNLKPHKSSQATMILKNLNAGDLSHSNQEDKLNRGLELLKSVSIENIECYQFLRDLEVGLQFSISDSYLKYLLSETNLFPLMTYKEFETILKTFIVLHDPRSMITFITNALESGQLDSQPVDLIIQLCITHRVVIAALSQFDVFLELILNNIQTQPNRLSNLSKFSDLVSKVSNNELIKDRVSLFSNDQLLRVDRTVIKDLLLSSGLSTTVDNFLKLETLHTNFQVLIKILFADSVDANKRKNIIELLLILRMINPPELNKTLFVYIKKTYNSTSDLFKFEPLLDLITSELITLNLIVETFLSFSSPFYSNFVLDLLFKDFTQPDSSFDFFKFALLREQFKSENPKIVLKLIQSYLLEADQRDESIQSESTELINSLFPESSQYRSEFLMVFLDGLIHNPDIFLDSLTPYIEVESQKVKLINLLKEMIVFNIGEFQAESNSGEDVLKSLSKLNKFNLPVFQILFRLLFNSDISDSLISKIIGYVFQNITNNEELFGALFDQLDYELKLKLLHYLEASFLNSKTFPTVIINDHEVELKTISGVLTSLSSGSRDFGLKDELIFSLDVALESLLKIVSQADTATETLYDAISLFLKIIIIHKSFLVGIIIERNSIKESFLNNIVTLLATKIVSQNLQLKNLLYDLILSIKSNVNEMNSSQINVIKLPLSMINLPAISSNIQERKNENSHGANLHDFNIINNIAVYQKGSTTFHDFNVKPFDLLEESNPIENINDTAISLQLFEGSLERKNPV